MTKRFTAILFTMIFAVMSIAPSFASVSEAQAQDDAAAVTQSVTESAAQEAAPADDASVAQEAAGSAAQEAASADDASVAQEAAESAAQETASEDAASVEQDAASEAQETEPEDQNALTQKAEENTAQETSDAAAEEAVKKEDEMPAGTFRGSAGGVGVTVAYGENIFPAGTEMRVAPASSAQVKALAEAVTDGDVTVVDALAVDISFYSGGAEIKPAGDVRVALRTSRAVEGEEHSMIHVADNGGAEIVAAASARGASAAVRDFSVYGIIGGSYESGETEHARYTYIFKVHGHEVDRQIVRNGEKLREPARPADKSFDGWEAEGDTKMLDFSKPISIPADAAEDKTIIVHAVMGKVYYATFYEDVDKKRVLQTKEGKEGQTISTTDVTWHYPNETAIVGWKVEGDSSGKSVKFVTFNDRNISLIPIHSPYKEHQVTFKTGQGTPVAPVFVKDGESFEQPKDPTRSGYAFTGWYTDEACNDPYDFTNPVKAPLTLYAGWEGSVTDYRVAYWKQNAEDDNYSFAEMVTRRDHAGTAATYDPKNYGEGFKLNTEKSNETVLIKGDGTTIKNVYYDRETYTLEFQAFGNGSRVRNNNNQWVQLHLGWKSIGSQTFKYEQDTSAFWNQVVNSNGGIYSNYVWRETTGTDTFLGDAKPMPAKDWTLYGRKDTGTGLILYYEKGRTTEIRARFETASFSNFATDYQAPKIPGFTYDYHTGPSREKIGGKYFDAVGKVYYERNTYAIAFNTNGGPAVTTKTNIAYEASLSSYNPSYYTPGATTKFVNGTSMTFAGWYTDATLQQPFNFNSTMPALEVTINANKSGDKNTLLLYAKWTAGQHTVSFDLDGGACGGEDAIPDQIVESGEQATEPKGEMIKDGYVFNGWKDATGQRFSFDSIITENKELTAIWRTDSAQIITVKYDVNGGAGSFEDVGCHAGINAAIKGQPVPPDGKYFKGWKIGISDEVMVSGSFAVTYECANEDHVIVLTAQYEDRPAYPTRVIYDPNGGELMSAGAGKISVKEFVRAFFAAAVSDDPIINYDYTIIDEVPVREGYTFLGWSTDPNATKAMFKGGDKVASGNHDNGENILYAVWQQDSIGEPEPGPDPEPEPQPEPEPEPEPELTPEPQPEPELTPEPIKVSDSSLTEKGNSSDKPASPKTGDENSLVLWFAILLVSLISMVLVLIGARKRRAQKSGR